MNLYIDKENLKSFIRAKKRPEYNECYEDCKRLLSRQLHIIYNFSKDEIKEDEELMPFFQENIMSGRSFKEAEDSFKEADNNEPIRPPLIENAISLEDISYVHLSNDESIVDNNEKNNSNLIGKVGEEICILQKLFCGNDYDFHKLYDIQKRKQFPNWDTIRDQILPCTDILIIDRYIAANQNELLEYNLYKIIELLVENVRAEINIVIVMMSSSTDMKPSIDEAKLIQESIKRKVKGITNHKCFVTIIFRKKNTKENDSSRILPHDRTILTNYKLFRSGDSFCYFMSNGDTKTKGKSLDIDSLAKNSTFEFAKSILQDIQKLHDNIKKLNSDFIVGDKKSHILFLETE